MAKDKSVKMRTIISGSATGYVEKSQYIEGELKKTIDVVIDELIRSKPTQGPLTVLKTTYDELTEIYTISVQDLIEMTDERDMTLSENERLKAEVESLSQTVDSEKLLRSIADNEQDASNNRYTSLLNDFQIAVTKGIREAIERVSLEAQVSGLNAQNESLKDQLSGAQAESTAAASGLSPDITGDMYYKFTSNEDANNFIWTTSRKNPTDNKFGKIDIQNLRDDNITIKKLDLVITYDDKENRSRSEARHILNHGPIGFTDRKVPSLSKQVDIPQGTKVSIPIFGGSQIGGDSKNTPEPDDWLSKDRTYVGTIKVITTFEDGITKESDVINWTIKKT